MPRLIDADALKTVLQRDQRYNVISFDKRYDDVGFSYDQVMFTIDKQPTIDAEPIVRPHGIESTDDRGYTCYECSQCSIEYVRINGTPADNDYLYCPHCGAKIDEEA